MDSDFAKKEDKLLDWKDVRWVSRALVKGWYLLLVLPLIFATIGAFNSYKKKRLYTTQIEIILESNDQIYDYQNSIYNNVGYLYTNISNQMRKLKSYDLIKVALGKLDLNVTYYIVGRINTKEVYWGVPFKIKLKSFTNKLKGKRISFKVLNNAEFQLEFDFGGEKIKNTHKFGENVITNWYSMLVTGFPGVGNTKAEYELEFHTDDFWINKVKNGLEIVNQEYTTTLQLSLVDEIPNRSKTILDTLAAVYIESTTKNQFDVNDNTVISIDKAVKRSDKYYGFHCSRNGHFKNG